MEHELLHRRAVLVLSGTVRMRSASSLMKHCFGDRRENWAAFPTFHFHHQKARSRFPAAAFAAARSPRQRLRTHAAASRL
jgi:hypothetical protein